MGRARWIPLLTSVLLSGCQPAVGEPPDCDTVGAHIEKLCGLFTATWAEQVRHECETLGMSASARRCVVRSTTCEDTTLGACDVHSRTWVCTTAGRAECPPGLTCDVRRIDEVQCVDCIGDLQCVACFGDQDCEAGRFCLDGWCLDDTADHRTLQDLIGAP